MDRTVDNVIGVGGRMRYAQRAGLDAGFAGWLAIDLNTSPNWTGAPLGNEQAYMLGGYGGYDFSVENLTIDEARHP